MDWQFTPYTVPVFVAAIIAGALSLVGWRRRPAPGAGWFTAMMFAAFVWALCYGLEMISVGLPTTILWSKAQYFGAVSIAVTWLALVLTYTGQREWLTRRNVGLFFIIPLITLALAWTNEFHELIWMNVGLETGSSFNTLSFTPGMWYWVNIAYAYAIFVFSTILLVVAFTRSTSLYRRQIIVLLIFSLTTWLGNLAYTVGLTPQRMNLTPVTFSVSGLLIAWGLFRYRMLDIVPVARDIVMEHMSDGVIVLDHQNRVVDLNSAAQALFGRTPSEAIGQPIIQVLADWPALAERCQNEGSVHTELTLPTEDKQHIFDLRISPFRDRRGQLSGRLMVWRDITERKRAEEELRKLSRAVEQSSSTIVITDLDGNIEFVNPAFARITGYAPEEVIGENTRTLKSGEHTSEFYQILWETITRGKTWQGEFINRKKNGELYWEAATISPVKDRDGKITHYVAVKEDITARKQAEEMLRQYATELELRNAELDAFAHTVAHDLKNPLTAMIGFSSLLQSHFVEMSEEDRQGFLQKIEQSGFKIQSIVDELLLLASVREMSEIGTGPLDMGHIVAESLKRLNYLVQEHQAEIVLSERWPMALGYGPWVEEVWVNYLSNAIKYGGQPPRVQVGATVEAAGRVRFWVRDNGDGLSSEERARLFTPFERLHQVSIEGHGLGLSVVRRIVEKLGGQVGVESGEGQGSTFYFTLPGVEPP